ncbi:endonuclease [Glaciihabitans sp. INWT7]|nr:endonuclease [Glaciihabitans sp. INWT7]
MPVKPSKENRYQQLAAWIFAKHFKVGETHVEWTRDELPEAADALGIKVPKNLGDVLYAIRYRIAFPKVLLDAAPDGSEWIIRSIGMSKYAFDLIPAQVRVKPNLALTVTKIPDATPEIIAASALGDEQALLALVRYNRLIDIFLGVASYSLQNHLRTTAKGVGQVEVDEVYVAVDRHGQQFILPVQAKGGSDEIGITQTEQDIAVCAEKWPGMICRPISAQFANDGRIALFELAIQDDQVRVRRESHYVLVQGKDITTSDLLEYRLAAGPEGA